MDGASSRHDKEEGGEDYYRGLGGYGKSVYPSEKEYGGKRVFIEFEGANTVTELLVNCSSAGRHAEPLSVPSLTRRFQRSLFGKT